LPLVPRPPALALSRTFVTTLTLYWPVGPSACRRRATTPRPAICAPPICPRVTAEAAAQHPLVFFLGPSRPWVHPRRPSSGPMSCHVQYMCLTKCSKEAATQLRKLVLPSESDEDWCCCRSSCL
jgi:hypothetical protein